MLLYVTLRYVTSRYVRSDSYHKRFIRRTIRAVHVPSRVSNFRSQESVRSSRRVTCCAVLAWYSGVLLAGGPPPVVCPGLLVQYVFSCSPCVMAIVWGSWRWVRDFAALWRSSSAKCCIYCLTLVTQTVKLKCCLHSKWDSPCCHILVRLTPSSWNPAYVANETHLAAIFWWDSHRQVEILPT